jgi:hypothetical protein
MWWNPLYDRDAAHAWLRSMLLEIAQETTPQLMLE